MAISSVMNASTLSSISNRVSPTTRAPLHPFFAAYGRLRPTTILVALLWRQPLVTFPPSPFHPPIPERATRTMRLQRTVKKRIRNISLLGVLRDLSRTRVFRLFQSIYTDPYSSAWRPVTTKLPVRENFLLEAGVTMCSKCLSCPLDRPEQSRTSVLICTARTLRVLGVSRLDNGSIYLTQPFYAGVTFCPRSEGRALKCHHPHGHVPRWLSRSCRLSAVSLLPSWAQMNASCPKASLSP